ncbi:sensor histidine kinase [Pseudoduganella namucuonensis]|uniref:histidine kinase n=1 Tax=Pseudoduganella namucuonensis TaxID=1035707 RepID=A0A1I7LIY4_9BURK|nr:PAS domain-containing sensor histidine kinase [Pseudoduganella namucuonensis]SFV09529.1 two-component system, NtrC family, sensor histidine kinase PilS [Pseudoduganella namucuonensis]
MVARLHALTAESRETFWRSLQTLNGTRVVIAVVLLVYLSFDARGLRVSGQFIYAEVCLVYLLLAAVFALLTVYARRRFLLQLLAQIACDLAIISLLYLAAGGVRSGLAILYLFPLAGMAILAPLLLALFSASLVALFMLGESAWQIVTDGDTTMLLAGLSGAAFLAVVVVVNRMAAKLIGQEELAVRRGVEIGVQQAVNRLVMSHMSDGIVVLGVDGQVLAGNPAAQQMLGLVGQDLNFRLASAPALEPLAQAFDEWHADATQHTAFVTIKPYMDPALQGVTAAWSARRDLAAHLKARFAAVDTSGLGVERSVIFLQDVTGIENQAQELKLASMGRLTASIAHEVRNPLSAIGHATSLLSEDLATPVQQRLLRIVGDNVARVNRMVEDILQLSRKVQPHSEPLALDGFLAELVAEFEETHALAPEVVRLGGAARVMVRFDALHLREVVLNLLNNAVRYASGAAGSIRLFVVHDRVRRVELHVQDDGPGISSEVRSHLFEPFYTTSSKGTGLGLYLARELCLNNEAMLDYEYRFDSDAQPDGSRKSSGRFVITFARAAAKPGPQPSI